MTSMPRSCAAAISAWLVEPQSTVTISVAPAGCGGVEGGQREAVALLEPARHVRLDVQAEAAQREDQDREAGQAVRVEVAEDEDALVAAARGGREPVEQPVGVGQRAADRGGRRAGPRTRPSSAAPSATPAG